MGLYFNPDNGNFTKDKNSSIYVDKTGLLEYLNNALGTNKNCISLSHARRFGKSHAAGMIDAYYSLGSQSASLFDDTKIAESADYRKHLNRYNVIHIDVSTFWDCNKSDVIEKITQSIFEEIKELYDLDFTKNPAQVFMHVYKITGIPFVIIMDEWDCIIRNCDDKALVHRYLEFLHLLFKSEESKSFLALAYITGILPIKKIQNESALNNFLEFTMLKSRQITEYYGFTEDEVKCLCDQYGMDFETIKSWYNGYLIDGKHMYNPNSVSMAMYNMDFESYWKNTSSFASINNFINMNYAHLKDDILTMLAGGKVRVNTNSFQNDFTTVASKDDLLTALIHLGYLGYDADRKSAYIPNYEVATAFEAALSIGEWTDVAKSISNCDELLADTIEE